MTAVLARFRPHQQSHWQVTLGVARTSARGPVSTLRVLPPPGGLSSGLALSPDISGCYLVLSQWKTRLQRVDMTTGRISSWPDIKDPYPVGIAW